jgi:phospholipid/cholesterol/gamma-HCH transport system permease protein
VTTPLRLLGAWTLERTALIGRLAFFLAEGALHIFSLPLQWRKLIHQVYFIGAKSFLVVCLTGAFTGMVLGLQGYYTLVKFGSTGFLGSATALTLIRELGPVLTAIMVTGRAGSAIAAEIGIMRISEQIDALDTMDINPIRFLFSPRLAAALVSFPLLTAVFDTVGILGGYLTGVVILGINPGTYFMGMSTSVVMADVSGGFIKALFFGGVVATVCCFQGYFAHRRREFGAKGVSLATTSAVVTSCVLILVTDYVLTSMLL